jgi:hypothetical protein
LRTDQLVDRSHLSRYQNSLEKWSTNFSDFSVISSDLNSAEEYVGCLLIVAALGVPKIKEKRECHC